MNEPADPGGRLHGVSFHRDSRTTRAFGRDDVARELGDPEVFSWIDITAPDIAELNAILRHLEIDLMLVGHFDEPEILPRIVEDSSCLGFYLYEILDPESHLDTSRGVSEIGFSRLVLVLGSDFVITFHRKPLDAIDYVHTVCEEEFRLAGKTPGFIVFLLMLRCLYEYAHVNLANDNYLDKLEEGVVTGELETLAGDISTVSTNILTVKRVTASLQIVLMLLVTKRSRFISEEGRRFFGEMLQHVIAVRGAIDSSRDLLDGVVASLQARAANRTSEIAGVLTILSAIILPLTLISGIYGMNFHYMPELEWRHGYLTVIGLMALIALALILLFHRLGWINEPKRRRA